MSNSFSKINFRIIAHLMGLLLLVNGGFMLIAALVSLLHKDGVVQQMGLASLTAILIGGVTMFLTKNHLYDQI